MQFTAIKFQLTEKPMMSDTKQALLKDHISIHSNAPIHHK